MRQGAVARQVVDPPGLDHRAILMRLFGHPLQDGVSGDGIINRQILQLSVQDFCGEGKLREAEDRANHLTGQERELSKGINPKDTDLGEAAFFLSDEVAEFIKV